jgi:hypothetical protein
MPAIGFAVILVIMFYLFFFKERNIHIFSIDLINSNRSRGCGYVSNFIPAENTPCICGFPGWIHAVVGERKVCFIHTPNGYKSGIKMGLWG